MYLTVNKKYHYFLLFKSCYFQRSIYVVENYVEFFKQRRARKWKKMEENGRKWKKIEGFGPAVYN